MLGQGPLSAITTSAPFSVFRLADFEHSRRTPDADQYRRLQEVLGLEDIPESGERLTDITLTTIAACLAWTHGIPLERLATALGLTESEVREGIGQVNDRLLSIGLDVSVDRTRAHVLPVSWCAGPMRSTASVSPLTSAEVGILAVLYEHDSARVAEIEKVIGPATRSTLASLSLRGLVSCAAQGQVAKRRYWVTDHGLMSVAAFALRRRQPRRHREPPR